MQLRRDLAERGWIAGGLTALSLAHRVAGRPEEAAAFAQQSLEVAPNEGLRARFVAAAEESLRAADELAASGDST